MVTNRPTDIPEISSDLEVVGQHPGLDKMQISPYPTMNDDQYFPAKLCINFTIFFIIIAFCVPQLHLGQIFCHLLIALGLRGAGDENLSFILL